MSKEKNDSNMISGVDSFERGNEDSEFALSTTTTRKMAVVFVAESAGKDQFDADAV